MAFKRIASLRCIPLAHWPTVLLVIGYGVFWLELFVIKLPFGHSSYLAWLLSVVALVMCAVSSRFKFNRPVFSGAWFLGSAALLLMGVYLAIVIYAASRPVHLIQEYDALNYHLAIPRQHLLVHHFGHLTWSTADLYLLSLDYALAPFSLPAPMPNKWAMFVFAVGLMAMVYQLVKETARDQATVRARWAVIALLGSHVIAIQLGTAMLDLVIAYCFFACWHSLLKRHYGLAAIEGVFLVASKSFMPLQLGILFIIVIGITWFLVNRMKWHREDPLPWNGDDRRHFGIAFIIAFIIIAGPGIVKSMIYAGTPLFPFGVGMFKPFISSGAQHWESLVNNAIQCLQTKDGYGHGRSIMDFLKHMWLIAVPERGVNNAFDYPVGLVYLLMVVPFGVLIIKSLQQRVVISMIVVISVWWGMWWCGSQQTRFLIIPLIAMIIVVMAKIPRINVVLKALLVLALLIETISLVGAHRGDWGKSDEAIIRPQDLNWMNIDVNQDSVIVSEPDIAYAPVPVKVKNPTSVFVIDY